MCSALLQICKFMAWLLRFAQDICQSYIYLYTWWTSFRIISKYLNIFNWIGIHGMLRVQWPVEEQLHPWIKRSKGSVAMRLHGVRWDSAFDSLANSSCWRLRKSWRKALSQFQAAWFQILKDQDCLEHVKSAESSRFCRLLPPKLSKAIMCEQLRWYRSTAGEFDSVVSDIWGHRLVAIWTRNLSFVWFVGVSFRDCLENP